MNLSYKPLDPMCMGELAYFRNRSINSNPFDQESEPKRYDEWLTGWKQARQLSIDVLNNNGLTIVK